MKAIQNFAQNQPQRTDKLEQAKQLTEELYGQDGEGRKPIEGEVLAANKRTKILSVCLALAAVLLVGCILLIFFLTNQGDEHRYFSYESIYGETITDIEQFNEENDLKFLYYRDGFAAAEYNASRLVENDRLVYIIQNLLFVSESDFDSVVLGVCFSEDQFQQFDDFTNLNELLNVDGVAVNYKIESISANNIYARFTVDDIIYYLSIETSGGAETLQHYVALLLQ